MSRASEAKRDRDDAIQALRATLIQPPGSIVRVRASVVHVSRGGMGRRVQVLAPMRVERWHAAATDCAFLESSSSYVWAWEVWDASWTVAKACGLTFKPESNGACPGVYVGGCGFSATFEVLSRIGHALYPDDRKLADEWTRFQDR